MPSDDVDPETLGMGIGAALQRFPEVAAAYLFGSVARGTARLDSDVDVGLVLVRRGVHADDCHHLIGDIASRLEGVTAPRPVDVILLEDQGPIFCHQVLSEGRLVYEADRERRIDFESETIVRALDFRPTWEIAARGQAEGLRRWLRERRA